MKTISGSDYASMIRAGAARLGQNRKTVNDLNVFPIPDGDTGDNMFMTIQAGCDAIAGLDGESIGVVAQKASSGMLLGARGNSGVILSRIFAGIGKGLADCETADLTTFGRAMESGVSEAYSAVSTPVEGTILTVFKDGVNAANSAWSSEFEEYFDIFCEELSASLDRTPALLDVLRKAGVVDSGGAGFVHIADGMRAALKGESVEYVSAASGTGSAANIDLDSFGPDSVLEFGYCTEFLLRLQSSKVDMDNFDEGIIREWLDSVGESVVCFRDGSIVKVHVHTMDPGSILSHCRQWGEFLTIKVENMTLQHHGNRMEEKLSRGPKKAVAVVAVASGEGLVSLFGEMGADEVIEGGQTMNPSSEDFLRAFDKVNAETVYVLPNNSNIVMTATQAASLYSDSRIVVLPSKSLGAGYTLLGSIDFADTPADDVLAQAEEIIPTVVSGMVSRAVRDAEGVREGEYLGFAGGEILCSNALRGEALTGLCRELGAAQADIVLIVKGKDASQQEADEACSALQKEFPRAEFALVDGGQPVYDYIVILQ